MAATVLVERWTGAGAGSGTDITAINTRCACNDTHSTAGTTNPVPIPAAGTNYAFWVSTRLHVTVAPAGTINNLNWYTDGADSFGTGVTCKVSKASTGANAGYRQATSSGSCGLQLTTGNHTGIDATPADAFGKTSGAPLALTGTITATTGMVGDFVVYQMEVATTAAPGATPAETFTFVYDET